MELNGIGSLFIACVEIALLLNLLLTFEKNKANKLAIAIITLLSLYQVSEFLICYTGTQSNTAVLAALTIITFLPPLGLYFTLEFYKINFPAKKILFIPAIFFVVYFLFFTKELNILACTPFYASYYYPLEFLYGIFYYLPIWAVMIILPLEYKKIKNNKLKKKLTLSQIVGWYLTFLPTFILLYLNDTYKSAVESILCKQAFVLALSLSYFVMTNKEKVKAVEGNNSEYLFNH